MGRHSPLPCHLSSLSYVSFSLHPYFTYSQTHAATPALLSNTLDLITFHVLYFLFTFLSHHYPCYSFYITICIYFHLLLSSFPSPCLSLHLLFLHVLFLPFLPQINLNCWNTTEEITKYLRETGRGLGADDLYDLWGEFQRRARGLVEETTPGVTYGVVRSSALTEGGRRKRFLDPNYYVVQVCKDVCVCVCVCVCVLDIRGHMAPCLAKRQMTEQGN